MMTESELREADAYWRMVRDLESILGLRWSPVVSYSTVQHLLAASAELMAREWLR